MPSIFVYSIVSTAFAILHVLHFQSPHTSDLLGTEVNGKTS